MGEIAALITAFCWGFSALFFNAGGKKVGSVIVNRIRLLTAVTLVMITHWILMGSPVPLDASPERLFWLSISGIVGLILGDSFLFQALVLIGVRIPTLIMASVPVISTMGAWIFLGESLSIGKISAICLAVVGISIVVMDRTRTSTSVNVDTRRYALGILCSLGGAFGQAMGLVLAKKGLAGDYPVLSGVVIRMLAGVVALWGVTFLMGQAKSTFVRLQENPGALRSILFGSMIGPYVGIWLSLIAVTATYVGVASTLMALTPIILLPVMKWGYKEDISRQAVFGTLVSFAGVAMLFLIV